jgi:mono/diheme cytochrome c family protein
MIDIRAVALSLSAAILPGIAFAQAAESIASSGIYTEAQAARGQAQYTAHCASCHGDNLNGVDVAPALSGGTFSGNWKGQTAGALATRIRTTMPLDNPGSLGGATVSDVSAYILSKNGYPAGKNELPRDASLLQAIKLD